MTKRIKNRAWSSRRGRLALLSLLAFSLVALASYYGIAAGDPAGPSTPGGAGAPFAPPAPPKPAPPAPTAPAAPTITSSPSSPTNQTSASFSFNSAGATGYLCSLDGSPFAACTSPKSYPGPLSAGLRTFKVEATKGAQTSAATTFTWTIDTTAPTLSSVNRAAGSTNPTNTGPLTWTVTFSEPVNNVATGNFGLTTSGLSGTPSVQSATAVGGAPASQWTVSVKTTGTTSNGGTIQLNYTSKGSIQDPAGNAISTSPTVNGQAYTFDNTPPPAPSINSGPAQGSTVQSTSATLGFTDSEGGVTLLCQLDVGVLAPCNSGSATYSGLAQGAHTFQVEAKDALGNTSPVTTRSWTVDTVPPPVPTFTSTPANPSNQTSGSIGFKDSEAGVTFSCSLDGAPPASCISPKSFSGLAATGHTFSVTASDAAGNTSSAATFNWTIDTTPPTVVSINRDGTSPTKAANVSWTVTFSEPVTDVDAHDFALAISGLGGGPKIGAVTPAKGSASTTWHVTASTGSGQGTLGLNLVDDDSINDPAGNVLGGPGKNNGNFTGQTYQLDLIAPTLNSINRTAGAQNPTNHGPLTWTVTFSEPVTNVVSGDFAITKSGTGGTAPSISGFSGSGATYTITVSTTGTTGTNNAQIGVNLTTPGTIADLVGNGLATKTFNGQDYNYDTQLPPPPTIPSKPSNPTTSTTATFQFCDDPDNNGDTGCGDPNDINGAVLWCSLDGATAAPCTSPKTYTNLSSTQHNFCVYAVDLAGNQSGTTCYSWTLSGGSQPLTLSSDADGTLYPGGATRNIPVKFTNPNGFSVSVTSLTITPTSLPSGCLASDFTISSGNVSSGNSLTVPANGSVTLPSGAVSEPTILMKDTGVAQDNCKNASFTLSYTSGGTVSGSGSGSGSVGTASPFTVSVGTATGGTLMPTAKNSLNKVVDTVQVTITNNDSGAENLHQVIYEVTPGWKAQKAGHPDCTASSFSINGQPVGSADTETYDQVISGGGNKVKSFTIQMIDNGADQNACMGATISLTAVAS
jgi:hypothetical protein